MFNLLETAILTESDAQVPGSEFDHKISITSRLHICYSNLTLKIEGLYDYNLVVFGINKLKGVIVM